jgi:hypothetical protein
VQVLHSSIWAREGGEERTGKRGEEMDGGSEEKEGRVGEQERGSEKRG